MRRRERRSNNTSEDSTSVSSAEGSATGNVSVVATEPSGAVQSNLTTRGMVLIIIIDTNMVLRLTNIGFRIKKIEDYILQSLRRFKLKKNQIFLEMEFFVNQESYIHWHQ